jgi:hypothetical protein
MLFFEKKEGGKNEENLMNFFLQNLKQFCLLHTPHQMALDAARLLSHHLPPTGRDNSGILREQWRGLARRHLEIVELLNKLQNKRPGNVMEEEEERRSRLDDLTKEILQRHPELRRRKGTYGTMKDVGSEGDEEGESGYDEKQQRRRKGDNGEVIEELDEIRRLLEQKELEKQHQDYLMQMVLNSKDFEIALLESGEVNSDEDEDVNDDYFSLENNRSSLPPPLPPLLSSSPSRPSPSPSSFASLPSSHRSRLTPESLKLFEELEKSTAALSVSPSFSFENLLDESGLSSQLITNSGSSEDLRKLADHISQLLNQDNTGSDISL